MDQHTVPIGRNAEILESHPGIGRLDVDGSWNRAGSVFPKKVRSGFDVEVEAHLEGLVLFGGEIHVHFD